jgi:hypothetical protein
MQPAEAGEAGLALVAEGAATLQGLAFERGIERLGQGVVGRTADRAHRLPYPGRLAGSK